MRWTFANIVLCGVFTVYVARDVMPKLGEERGLAVTVCAAALAAFALTSFRTWIGSRS